MNPIRSTARRTVLRAVAAATMGAALMPAAFAADKFPSKPITMVVPFVAGGTTDILARIVGQSLGEELGQPVIIDNRAGAGGNIGGQFAARSAADGYTIFMGTVGTNAINEWLYKKMPFNPNKDFAPLTRVANVPNLLVANPQQPFKDVKELIAYAQANPGKVNFGSSGSGSSIHLSGELFKMMTKVDMVHIPYKGSAPAVTDLLGNQIAIMFDNMQAKLHAAIIKVLQKPDVIKKIADQGGEVVTESQAEFAKFIAAENEKWKKVVKTSGATAG